METFWYPWFLMQNHLLICWGFFLCNELLSRFTVTFSSLIMMCLGVAFFEFIIPGVSWVSWVCGLFFHQIWEVFSHYFYKHSFCPFLFSSPGIPILYMLLHLTVYHKGQLGSIHFSSFFFLSVTQTQCLQLFYLQVFSFFCWFKSAFETQ